MQDPILGVVLVAFDCGGVLLDCLESLRAATGVRLRVVVVDNASTDDTLTRLHDWASGAAPYTAPADSPIPLTASLKPLPVQAPGDALAGDAPFTLTLVEAGVNGGFAAGVNLGLAELAARPDVDRFWVLNPDSIVPPTTPALLAREAEGAPFALMGNRVVYLERPDLIQIDGGCIDWRTGVTRNIHQFAPHPDTPAPEVARVAFIHGASMVASRQFYAAVGPMTEDYFLYYEEVDWALRRGDLPLAFCVGAPIFHRSGASIGSGAPGRVAAPFSVYFMTRARLRFVRRFRPTALPGAYAFSLAKAAQMLAGGHIAQAAALLRAAHGLPPPPVVRRRLSPEAARRAFGRSRGRNG
ncbi:MAG: glycosyltransferase [Rhodobacteraceae bacterium]|nr:glycosyltransferase [Paracoccaceae bacterium]